MKIFPSRCTRNFTLCTKGKIWCENVLFFYNIMIMSWIWKYYTKNYNHVLNKKKKKEKIVFFFFWGIVIGNLGCKQCLVMWQQAIYDIVPVQAADCKWQRWWWQSLVMVFNIVVWCLIEFIWVWVNMLHSHLPILASATAFMFPFSTFGLFPAPWALSPCSFLGRGSYNQCMLLFPCAHAPYQILMFCSLPEQ